MGHWRELPFQQASCGWIRHDACMSFHLKGQPLTNAAQDGKLSWFPRLLADDPLVETLGLMNRYGHGPPLMCAQTVYDAKVVAIVYTPEGNWRSLRRMPKLLWSRNEAGLVGELHEVQ